MYRERECYTILDYCMLVYDLYIYIYIHIYIYTLAHTCTMILGGFAVRGQGSLERLLVLTFGSGEVIE